MIVPIFSYIHTLLVRWFKFSPKSCFSKRHHCPCLSLSDWCVHVQLYTVLFGEVGRWRGGVWKVGIIWRLWHCGKVAQPPGERERYSTLVIFVRRSLKRAIRVSQSLTYLGEILIVIKREICTKTWKRLMKWLSFTWKQYAIQGLKKVAVVAFSYLETVCHSRIGRGCCSGFHLPGNRMPFKDRKILL